VWVALLCMLALPRPADASSTRAEPDASARGVAGACARVIAAADRHEGAEVAAYLRQMAAASGSSLEELELDGIVRALESPASGGARRSRAIAAAKARAESLLESLRESPPRSPSEAEIRLKLAHVLARREFAAPPAKRTAVEAVVQWLLKVMERLYGRSAGASAFATWAVLAVLAVLAAASLMAYASRAIANRLAMASCDHGARPEADGELSAPADLLAEADRLAREGDLRAALERSFVATLVHLDRVGLIRYDPTRTNWENLASISRGVPASIRSRLAHAARVFDRVWYGHKPVSASEYSEVTQWLAGCRAAATATTGDGRELT